jgi:hypothetical protein
MTVSVFSKPRRIPMNQEHEFLEARIGGCANLFKQSMKIAFNLNGIKGDIALFEQSVSGSESIFFYSLKAAREVSVVVERGKVVFADSDQVGIALSCSILHDLSGLRKGRLSIELSRLCDWIQLRKDKVVINSIIPTDTVLHYY